MWTPCSRFAARGRRSTSWKPPTQHSARGWTTSTEGEILFTSNQRTDGIQADQRVESHQLSTQRNAGQPLQKVRFFLQLINSKLGALLRDICTTHVCSTVSTHVFSTVSTTVVSDPLLYTRKVRVPNVGRRSGAPHVYLASFKVKIWYDNTILPVEPQ
jgi:hypothetical protein